MTPREALYAETRMIPIEDAVGEIAADMLSPYPPGIPLVVPGERYTEAIVEYARRGAASGFFIEGVVDQTAAEARVVAR